MLQLSKKIELNEKNIKSPNLCHLLSAEDLTAIGAEVWDDYEADVQSRQDWSRRTSAAMDLAMQVQKDKSFPWPGCSNVAFPLITIASLQFHSRAYPAIIQGTDVVKCRVVGQDPDGTKTEKAQRISTYMSYQLLEEDECWESEEDRSLIVVPIVGTAFKKTYYDVDKGHPVSELVLAQDLVLNYWAKDVGTCGVKTHIIPLTANQMYGRCTSGLFVDVRDEEWYKTGAPMMQQSPEEVADDNRDGMRMPMPDSRTPFICLEQHRNLDLDGDGYAEPVIVTIEQSTHTVLRIVFRFDRELDIERNSKKEIINIRPMEYFTKIPFIPSPDGGIMDIGFGTLLGPLNESVDSAINQLFDSGTVANTAGGFLGRGAKIRGGVYNFSPFKWNPVDSTGDDLRKSVLPLPVREPSNVMFQLLSLLINYTEKISGAVDISTGGNPGQNTPAQTSQTMIEQGQKVYAAIFKRIWRSLKQEFRKMFILNGIYMPDKVPFAGSQNSISREDFLGDPSAIVPVADPEVISDQQRFIQSQALLAIGRNNPLYNQDVINKMYLRSLKVANIDEVYKGVKAAGPPQPTEKVQIELLKAQVQLKELELKKLQFVSSLLEQRRLNEAKIVSLYAQAALAEKQAGGVEAGTAIQAFQAKIDALKLMNDSIANQVNTIGGLGNGNDQQGTTGAGQAGGSSEGTIPQLASPPSDGNGNGMGAQ